MRPSASMSHSRSLIPNAPSRARRRASGPRPASRLSGSSPSGKRAKRSEQPGFRPGSAVSAARNPARRPAASPSRQSTGSAARRQSSAICCSVTAVPSGATAPGKPAWLIAITSM